MSSLKPSKTVFLLVNLCQQSHTKTLIPISGLFTSQVSKDHHAFLWNWLVEGGVAISTRHFTSSMRTLSFGPITWTSTTQATSLTDGTRLSRWTLSLSIMSVRTSSAYFCTKKRCLAISIQVLSTLILLFVLILMNLYIISALIFIKYWYL